MLSNYGCVISYRHQAAYHFDNTTVTSNNRSYLCNGNERHLSDCSTVLNDQCSQNASVYIHCQGETKFTSFFSPSLFYAVVDVGSPPPPHPPFFSFFLLSSFSSLSSGFRTNVSGWERSVLSRTFESKVTLRLSGI